MFQPLHAIHVKLRVAYPPSLSDFRTGSRSFLQEFHHVQASGQPCTEFMAEIRLEGGGEQLDARDMHKPMHCPMSCHIAQQPLGRFGSGLMQPVQFER